MSEGGFGELNVKIHCQKGAELPAYQSKGAAGADLRAFLKQNMVLSPGERGLIPTGISVQIPPGYELQVRPRSGLAFNRGLTVLNSPGTIDADYRGEIKVLLINTGSVAFSVEPGMRMAQLVLAPVLHMKFIASSLDNSERGAGGFGQTGLK